MSSTRKSERWLLVQWSNGGRGVVNIRTVMNPASEVKLGAVVDVVMVDGDQQKATIIGCSRDRQTLELQISSHPAVYDADIAGPSLQRDEQRDFSPSASSWEPSGDNVSTDEDDEVQNKKIKLVGYRRSYPNRRSSKIMKPIHRVNAINVNMNNRKRTHDDAKKKIEKLVENVSTRKSLPDSTRKNNSPLSNENKQDVIAVSVRDILSMKQSFHELFKIFNEIKPPLNKEQNIQSEKNVTKKVVPIKRESKEEIDEVREDEISRSELSCKSESEESNRSEDNVLISNKYENIAVKNKRVLNVRDKNQKSSFQEKSEWIPIGSGKTLIHRDQFRKVNWKSYTIATRTLLLAVFPRRILATHSLTGKRSPAFQNKPAKMCLDPKIVTDVIIEITEKFRVKENLVRSIITTKCADECKMYKMRLKRKTMPSKRENIPPEGDDNEDHDEPNQTC